MPLSEDGMSQQIKLVQIESRSAFSDGGIEEAVRRLCKQTQTLYLSDDIPWVVGYSGGKDSTATLQLIWSAIRALPDGERKKSIHVISTDTLVENPIVAKWVEHSLAAMERAAAAQGMPIKAHRLVPAVQDRPRRNARTGHDWQPAAVERRHPRRSRHLHRPG